MLQIASSLKINFNKSLLYAWKKLDIQLWSNTLGCKLCSIPIKFLDDNIGTNPMKRLFLKPLLDKFEGKLVSWNYSSLNQAGRKVLVSQSKQSTSLLVSTLQSF